MIGGELEQLLRRLIREELGRALAGDPTLNSGQGPDDDDAELRELAVEHAAKLRRSKGAH